MEVLLDECMPFPLIEHLAELSHRFDHAVRVGLAGLPNGAVYDYALAHHDLFVTNDRHFRGTVRYPLSGSLGIVFVRIAPCVTDLVAPPLRAMLSSEPEERLIGHRTVLRRGDWEIVE